MRVSISFSKYSDYGKSRVMGSWYNNEKRWIQEHLETIYYFWRIRINIRYANKYVGKTEQLRQP